MAILLVVKSFPMTSIYEETENGSSPLGIIARVIQLGMDQRVLGKGEFSALPAAAEQRG
jgi:hypothetical protein